METSKSPRKSPQIMKTLPGSSHTLGVSSGFANKPLFESLGGSIADLTLGGPFNGNYHVINETGIVGGFENRQNEKGEFLRLNRGKKTVHVLGLEFSLPSEGGEGNSRVAIAPCSQPDKRDKNTNEVGLQGNSDGDNGDESANHYGNGNVSVSVVSAATCENDEDVYVFDEEDRHFSVGEFVWGKIRSNTWWPGLVYSPSDASEYAAKHRERDRLLVAYFGDGSFSWCHPSQLEPFAEDFESMSKQSDSKNFVDAVEAALCTISKLVELDMTCSCQHEEIEPKISRPLASNAGIRGEVLVPIGGVGKFSVAGFEPAEFMKDLKSIAQVVSVNNMLEFTVMKARLSAFYAAKGGYQLQVFCAPQLIAGLEDMDLKPSMGGNDNLMDFQGGGPFVEEWLSSPNNQVSLQKHSSISEDKHFQRRKQKSMAEILEEEEDIEAQNIELHKMEKISCKSGPSSSPQKRGRKKKMKPTVTENEEKCDKNGRVSRRRKRKLFFRDEVDNNRNFSYGIDSSSESHENPKVRERKKSKYLSAPYTTDLKQWIQYSNSSDQTEFLEVSDGSIECTDFPNHSPESDTDDLVESLCTETKNQIEEDMTISPATILSDLEIAANGSDYLVPSLKGFFSVFRSSVYCNGSNYKAYHKSRKPHLDEKDDMDEGEAKYDDFCDSSSTAVLYLSFPPAFSLPSRADLIDVYSNFGPLHEEETDMIYNSLCGRVVFWRTNDAERALHSSLKSSPFGGVGKVEYKLLYPSDPPGVEQAKPRLPSSSTSEQVKFVKHKLEMLKSVLVSCDGGSMPEDMVWRFEGEIDGVLEVVSAMEGLA